jgi:hypothetical protein
VSIGRIGNSFSLDRKIHGLKINVLPKQ